MYMSKLNLDPRTAARMGIYEEHRALWDIFSDGPDRKRDFLYRNQGEGAYLTVSSRPPRDAQGPWRIQIKPYGPVLRGHEILAFSLRLNAVRKVRDEQGRQHRHDIVQDLRKRLMSQGQTGNDLPSRTVLAEQAVLKWFAAREEELGFSLVKGTLVVETYHQQTVRKEKGNRPIRFSTLDLYGKIQIHDPVLTKKCLMRGIGNAKGLGCGLLLVKRI
ncbi:type I-E CRISPR-associated protein Cas6/Cse3/CasE [Desulfonatronum parangueonense]